MDRRATDSKRDSGARQTGQFGREALVGCVCQRTIEPKMKKNIPSLYEFLETKPLYYKEIDHERVHVAYNILKPHIKRPTTVHIVGTNGKGSTGRMIAHLARSYGMENGDEKKIKNQKSKIKNSQLSVGHYTSPHILKFNERIWLNGADASDEVLEEAHERLYKILGEDVSAGLSYFEYTTLLAFVVFEDCDLVVLEAGLGGEYDATNVCDKELSVITPIGLDHQAFLGDTIEEIAATKIRSIQKRALLAPQPFDEVVKAAKQIAFDVEVELFLMEKGVGSKEEVRFARHSELNSESPANSKEILNDRRKYPRVQVQDDETTLHSPLSTLHSRKAWPDFLIQNAWVAMQALDILNISYDANDLRSLELFGRFYPLRDNIRIDVGHNSLAARAIVEAMEPDTVLIYNSLDDKDYEEVLRTLQPKIKRVEIIRISSQRAATLQAIEEALKKIGLAYSYFEGDIDLREHYLVFGSFYVVEGFIKALGFDMSEKLKIKN
jgi:dihydrofolate synthase/folylpolyglutamate synthase